MATAEPPDDTDISDEDDADFHSAVATSAESGSSSSAEETNGQADGTLEEAAPHSEALHARSNSEIWGEQEETLRTGPRCLSWQLKDLETDKVLYLLAGRRSGGPRAYQLRPGQG